MHMVVKHSMDTTILNCGLYMIVHTWQLQLVLELLYRSTIVPTLAENSQFFVY